MRGQRNFGKCATSKNWLTHFIEAPVDLCNLRHPTLALGVLQGQDLLMRPVKVIRNVRYLLVEPL